MLLVVSFGDWIPFSGKITECARWYIGEGYTQGFGLKHYSRIEYLYSKVYSISRH